MAQIGVDDISLANGQDPKNLDDFPGINPRPQMSGLDVSYSTGNQWFCSCPLEDTLGKRYRNLQLHLTKFSLPQMMVQTSTVSFRGYQKEISNKVLMPDSKELTLEYIVDENWQNYRALYSWMSGGVGVINPVVNEINSGINPSDFITLRIYLMDNYKKKKIQFCFENCFIKVFNDLQLDVTSQDVINHSFTFAFDRYFIEDV